MITITLQAPPTCFTIAATSHTRSAAALTHVIFACAQLSDGRVVVVSRNGKKRTKRRGMPKMTPLSKLVITAIFLPILVDCVKDQGTDKLQHLTVRYPCEIAVVLADSQSISDTDFERLIRAMRSIPDYFPMGPDRSRISVVFVSGTSRVLFNLTSDESAVRSMNPEREKFPTDAHHSLRDVKEKLFADVRPDAVKIVVLITDGQLQLQGESIENETEDAAGDLKEKGSLIYVAVFGPRYRANEDIQQHVVRVAGDPSQVFPMDDFGKLKAVLFKRIRYHVMCHFRKVCRFEDPEQRRCTVRWWRTEVNDIACNSTEPSEPRHECKRSDCEETCRKWKWKTRECDGSNAGKTVAIERDEMPTPAERSWMYENCPRKTTIACPMAIPKPRRLRAVTATTEKQELPTPDDEGEEETTSDDDTLPTWVIVAIVIIGILLLVLLIFCVLLFRKRKLEATAKEAEMAKEATRAKELVVAPMIEPVAEKQASMAGTAYSSMANATPGADESIEVSIAEEKLSGRGSSKSGKAASKNAISNVSKSTIPKQQSKSKTNA